jgi:hypothetical protein
MMITDHDDGNPRHRLPTPPTVFSPTWAIDMDVYVRFARALRNLTLTMIEQKLLVAIDDVSNQMAAELSEDDVALTLVQLGLRAPRGAFPGGFVNRVLDAHLRHMRRGDTFDPALADLLAHWGLPVRGMAKAPRPTPGFQIGSIPQVLRRIQKELQQNSLGLLAEPVL